MKIGYNISQIIQRELKKPENRFVHNYRNNIVVTKKKRKRRGKT